MILQLQWINLEEFTIRLENRSQKKQLMIMDVMFLNHKRYSRQKKLSQLQPQMNLPQLNKRLPNQNSPFLSLIPKINLMKRPSKELKKLSRRIRINSLVLILM